MKVNIYYGGRGLIEDSTLYVLNKITEVLEEIRVEVHRYNLYEQKNSIAMLPKTLKEANAIILAAHVEWLGIGGLLYQFLDSCWLYGDKKKMKNLYMMPIIISNAFGERQAELELVRAWELLGGMVCEGICSYVSDQIEFESNPHYKKMIEKKAENLYRTIQQKLRFFPSSTNAVIQSIPHSSSIDLTPQESEQLSAYVSNDTYVKKQKEDIEELSQLFKGLLEKGESEVKQEFVKNLRENFRPPDNDFSASYAISINDVGKILIVEVNHKNLKCYYGTKPDADVTVKLTREVMNKLVTGRTTFQGAFMSGELTAKGDFKTLRYFDQLFQFNIIF